MSEFIGFYSDVMELGTSSAVWQAEFKSVVTGAGWRVLQEEAGILDLIPPVDEPIGNDEYFNFLRVKFSSGQMEFLPGLYATEQAPSFPSVISTRVEGTLSGHREITINGVDVVVAGNEGATLREKAELFADRISNEPLLADIIDGAFVPTQASNSGYFYIVGKMGVDLRDITVSVNIPGYLTGVGAARGHSFLPGNVVPSSVEGRTGLTLPTSSFGFAYYIGVHNRTINVAIKDEGGYHGPISCGYGAHSDAVSLTPDGGAPVELVVVSFASSIIFGSGEGGRIPASPRDSTRVSHVNGVLIHDESALHTNSQPLLSRWWEDILSGQSVSTKQAMAELHYGGDANDVFVYTCLGGDIHAVGNMSPYAKSRSFGVGEDIIAHAAHGGNYFTNGVRGSLLFGGSFGVHGAVFSYGGGPFSGSNNLNGQYKSAFMAPIYIDLPDSFYHVDGGLANESLSVAAYSSSGARLVGNVDAVITSIEVDDVVELSPSGTVIVGGEVITYDSIVGNVLTNCVRGAFGTDAVVHDAGAKVHRAGWFLKFNYGMIYVGDKRIN